jgi:hypothetical protein
MGPWHRKKPETQIGMESSIFLTDFQGRDRCMRFTNPTVHLREQPDIPILV